jgi:hypothetical protein
MNEKLAEANQADTGVSGYPNRKPIEILFDPENMPKRRHTGLWLTTLAVLSVTVFYFAFVSFDADPDRSPPAAKHLDDSSRTLPNAPHTHAIAPPHSPEPLPVPPAPSANLAPAPSVPLSAHPNTQDRRPAARLPAEAIVNDAGTTTAAAAGQHKTDRTPPSDHQKTAPRTSAQCSAAVQALALCTPNSE